MRFHVVGLPHTVTNMSHSACAFTMKILHFCQMMHSLGHEVIHYGVEGSDVPCEHVEIMSRKMQEHFFGPYDPGALYTVDWTGQAVYWQHINDCAATEINLRKQKGDFVCVMAGSINRSLAAMVGDTVMTVEYGIGYNGTFSDYRVFESYAHLHKIRGAEAGFDPNGKFYDAVIPNYLNPDDYPFKAEKQDYFLYLGRLIQRKGIDIAVETCKAIGARLVVAGQGMKSYSNGVLVCDDGCVYKDVDYVGFATGQKRADLYSNAKGVFVPTKYVEPFGAVAVEAQMAGTPAITTDFGAFTETVQHGFTGFRCHTLNEFVHAAKTVHKLDPMYIHRRAVNLYGMNSVRHQYETYFQRLSDLWGDGWYVMHEIADQHWLKG